MPIYEYKCDSCETKFEKLIRRESDERQLACPSCGERHLSQQYSTFAAHAGSGAAAALASAAPQCGAPQCGAPQCGSGMCGAPGMCGMN